LELLDRRVRGTEDLVDLREARECCCLIEVDSHRPGEIFNQLGHMFVLLESLRLMRGQGFVADSCAPTQQSIDARGRSIADLSGPSWALEAFGGVDIRNNGKLAKGLKALQDREQTHCRVFLACRTEGWALVEKLTERPTPFDASCSKKHGGPIKARAEASLADRSSMVTVVEVSNIELE
jgi:hypothetical protein